MRLRPSLQFLSQDWLSCRRLRTMLTLAVVLPLAVATVEAQTQFITPGKKEPAGFVLTTILGIAGAFVATYLGQWLGWYRADEAAGLIGAVVGAIIILAIWGLIAGRRSPSV